MPQHLPGQIGSHEETENANAEGQSGHLEPKQTHITAEEHRKNLMALAALESIRLNQFIPFNIEAVRVGSNDTTSQKVIFDPFDPGFVYIISTITASDADDAAHQIKIGVTDGAKDFVYEASTVANAGDSVEYVGQLFLKETDKVFAEFRSVGANDKLQVFMNGYKIRR